MEQSGLETLTECPICSGKQFSSFLSCIDHTVSHETFHIVQCQSCDLKFTNPRPTEQAIGKYYQSEDYISHSNSSKGVINLLYKTARRFTISRKTALVRSISPNGTRFLDYGCGTGEFLYSMKKSGWISKGIEPSPQARNFAIDKLLLEVFPPDEINFFPPASFDVITLWHVLEHVHQLNETIRILKNLLSDKGKLIIAVPNSDAADAGIYNEVWAAYDLPRHLYHFNAASITRLLSNHEMQVKKIIPMALDAFYVSMLSEKYKKSLFGMVRGVLNGAKTNFKSWSDRKNASSLIFIIETFEI